LPSARLGLAVVIACLFTLRQSSGVSAQTGAHSADSAADTTPLTTLTTARAAHDLSLKEAARGHPVLLHATVTYYDASVNSMYPVLFVADATGSVFVSLSQPLPAVPLMSGELVEISGVSGKGDFAPVVWKAHARVLGRSRLPALAPRVTATDMMTGTTDGQWVEVRGIVHAFRRNGKEAYLDLVLADGPITAFTVFNPAVDYDRLVDATVILRGNAAPLFNNMGQMTGAHLIFPGMQTLRVVDPAPVDPFAGPVQPIGDILRYTPHSTLSHRAHIRGKVTLLWPGKLICIQDGAQDGSQDGAQDASGDASRKGLLGETKSLCAQTQQTSPLDLGQTADVIGFPEIGDFTPTLEHAIYRAAGAVSLVPTATEPIDPTPVTYDQAISDVYDSRLVSIEGKLINENRAGDMPNVTLATGNSVFTVAIPKSYLPDTVGYLPYGSIVRVTGICAVHSDRDKNRIGNYATPTSFTIYERKLSDLTIVQTPSWWNGTHTLWVLAGALLVTFAAVLGLAVLRRKVKQQTATIRAQLDETHALKEAAEFQATHDGLTGLLNRKAVFEMLQHEAALAMRYRTTTGIIMLDLDHFKKINDTHGHAAGDDVIREAVRRILPAVRTTDWVGRYGGEEFLLILPKIGRADLIVCAERIRASICCEPVIADGKKLLVSASVGATVATFPVHNAKDAVIAADLALYDAKHEGRNRVAFRDIEANNPDPVRNPAPDATLEAVTSPQTAGP
jgi:diguanylate cyclase (GGDEF)-like protein